VTQFLRKPKHLRPRAAPPPPPDEWDVIRAQLKPCPKCGAPSDDLLFKCAQVCTIARVYCGKCGFGIGYDGGPMLIVYAGDRDARPAAVEKWNAEPRP